jgi:hypothetical protein
MFMLYFQDEFLNGNYHIPIDRRFYNYAMITEGILQNIQQMYEYPVEYTNIPAVLESVQYRNTGDKTRVDFSVGLPDSLLDPRGDRYILDFILFDKDWNVVLTDQRSFFPDTLGLFWKSSAGWRVFPFTMDLPLLQLESNFAVEIRGGKPAGRALYRGSVTIRDLGGSHLSMSGIRFSLLDTKNGCLDIVDPLPSYETGSAICVSYEIYNLKRNKQDLARYRLTWSVVSSDEKSGPSGTWEWIRASMMGSAPEPEVYVSSSMEQNTSGRPARDSIMLDTGPLEPGRYLLKLEIEDLVAGGTVSGEKPFAIIPRKGS